MVACRIEIGPVQSTSLEEHGGVGVGIACINAVEACAEEIAQGGCARNGKNHGRLLVSG
jgi:hypothetical protein